MTEAKLPADFFRVAPVDAASPPVHSPELISVGEVDTPPIPIETLVKVATPLINAFVDADREKQQRLLALEEKALETNYKHQRILTLGFFGLAAVVLFLAGVLVFSKREIAAIDLIKTCAALGGAGFGGYGIANATRRSGKKE